MLSFQTVSVGLTAACHSRAYYCGSASQWLPGGRWSVACRDSRFLALWTWERCSGAARWAVVETMLKVQMRCMDWLYSFRSTSRVLVSLRPSSLFQP
jgi:hypothetical protein